jgi:lysophospholipase L1-like esterase
MCFHRILVFLGAFALFALPELPAQNASTVRAVANAVIGRTPLSEADQAYFDTLQAAALKNPQVTAALLAYEKSRQEYQADRRKFPADRDREVALAYRRATADASKALREAMIAADPKAAAFFERLARAPKRQKNEGENATDSDTGNKAAVAPIKDVAGLPRVLLIGDSISIGYTLPVRAHLAGKANVHRIPVNGGATEVGLENIDAWLGSGKWDVIHFNFGLHDAKYFSATTQRASRDDYVANLQKLVNRMKATGAKLIFATTTPVPEILQHGKAKGNRVFDSIPERNALAVALMKKNGVAVDDLYTVIAQGAPGLGRENDVHFSPEGYEVLARAVADSIATQLPAR